MLLRQVQARPLQGHRLRALRRRGDALEGAPRAHGPHRPRRAGLAHLVLQGRAEPDRLPARHRSQGAREGPLLRRLDRLLRSTRRRARRTSTKLEKEVNKVLDAYEAEKRGAPAGAARVARAAPRVPQDRQADRLQRRGPPVGRRARDQRQEALRRRPREAREGRAQGVRPGHRRHRGLHRRRRRAHARRPGRSSRR